MLICVEVKPSESSENVQAIIQEILQEWNREISISRCMPELSTQEASSSTSTQQAAADSPFKYVLHAPTIIDKGNTLSNLTKGELYKIELKSTYPGKLLSYIKLGFDNTINTKKILPWQQKYPVVRILEGTVADSCGAFAMFHPSYALNSVHFYWDPTKGVEVYIRVNCIGTDFITSGQHGVPFRLQVETYYVENSERPLHAAACQIKVFQKYKAPTEYDPDEMTVLKDITNEYPDRVKPPQIVPSTSVKRKGPEVLNPQADQSLAKKFKTSI